ncbi:MAG: DUF3422 domain-containing protein [Pseudomonadota bacterium]
MELNQASDHPRRYALTNELHARPFQPMEAPGRVLHIAFKPVDSAAERDPEEDFAHLLTFIDRHGGPHPAEGTNHYSHEFGRFRLKWERHTEFVAYTLYEAGARDRLFARGLSELLPQEWIEAAPGKVIAAIDLEVTEAESAEALLETELARYFAPDSLVASRVMDGAGLAVADFRIHEGGFTRFAIILERDVAPRRLGRAVQRLSEIEHYRTLALLALPIARSTSTRLTKIEGALADVIAQVAAESDKGGDTLAGLLRRLSGLSAEIEALSAASAFRFGAAGAYGRIVQDRIEMLREKRVPERQTFREFMLRRFDPAMQTVASTAKRLEDLSRRASRIAQLLRTRVDVEMEAQNQQLLRSMDKRADLHLRLQKTVEGLSVVAISYYAVSLMGYVLAPLETVLRVDKAWLTAAIALPTVFAVWWMARRVRKSLEKEG